MTHEPGNSWAPAVFFTKPRLSPAAAGCRPEAGVGPMKFKPASDDQKEFFFLKNSRIAKGSVLHSDSLLVFKTHRDGFSFF